MVYTTEAGYVPVPLHLFKIYHFGVEISSLLFNRGFIASGIVWASCGGPHYGGKIGALVEITVWRAWLGLKIMLYKGNFPRKKISEGRFFVTLRLFLDLKIILPGPRQSRPCQLR